MKHLIFGGTGNIGSRVTERLIARGERPSVFVRNAKKAKVLFGDQVDIHVGDLEARAARASQALACGQRGAPTAGGSSLSSA